ncbi:hypothetical protein ACTUVN_002368 [Pseudomonas caspiana]
MVEFDLNYNDAEALFRHVLSFIPNSGDAREDARLKDALVELADALQTHLRKYEYQSPDPTIELG